MLFQPPKDVAGIQLEKRDSATIIVDKMWLARENGELVIKGYVMAQSRGLDTTKARLLVSIRDGRGTELRSATLGFTPQQISRGYKSPGFSTFAWRLDPMPAGAASIVISAVDAPSESGSRKL